MKQELIDLLESNLDHAEKFNEKFDELQDSQEPDFVTVCCSDSRVLQDHMWGNKHPGHVFTCSNIGNRVTQKTSKGEKISGDVLYPLEHTGTQTVIVVGHTGCGAVTATYRELTEGLEEPEGITHCIELLKQRLEDGLEKLPDGLEDSEAVNRLVEYNVDQQINQLLQSEDIPEKTDVIGVVYDFQDVYSDTRGKVHLINVNGENNPEEIREKHSEAEARVNRLWTP
ncbi:carbonic anhydrase [Candidatus Nanohalovita haloferacivicina]|uniref:carbonic anhydrase n=1 Tax=Candidatus Nanohalovita haloferacivicina TaxID=2978046 RepID=UPI00325FD641|nr:Carbonic anhydrase [Candidatus Nanohalobia archaeon BNXNv]